jgi:ectoine hydroxylase-related dioxygenase (phytanoyl-CoA dioxygenase family)
MSIALDSPIVTDEQKQQYQQDGYMILERVIPEDMLTMLREECHYFVGYKDGQMDAKGEKSTGITHRGSRYFIGNMYRMSHRMWRFIYSDLMAEVCLATLGADAQLFNEQWVVKGPEQGMKFAWHQDSGYVKHGWKQTVHRPYLSCWCALDDVSEANGTVYILPHDRAGTRHTIIDHTLEQGTNDLIGYTGDDPGIPVVCPAGSIVAFTSYTLHRSGANTSRDMRRIYLAQYSGEPILNQHGGLWAQAVPFLKDGVNVYDRATDTPDRWMAARA